MATYVLRVWLPDRPGALGAVASRIGAVRGDLVGIDILERTGGRVIDELVVELPDDALVPLLLSEVVEVDGVEVEDLRIAPEGVADPRLDLLVTAAVLVEHGSRQELVGSLARRARHDFEADWAVLVDLGRDHACASDGAPPAPERVLAVARAADDGAPEDVAFAPLPATELVLVVGRRGRVFRARERAQLGALARIAGRRACELGGSPTEA